MPLAGTRRDHLVCLKRHKSVRLPLLTVRGYQGGCWARFHRADEDPCAMAVARTGWGDREGGLRKADARQIAAELSWMQYTDVGHAVCARRVHEVFEIIDHPR